MTAREELERFVDSFNGDEAGDIDRVYALDGNTGYAMRGGNDVESVLNKARNALIAEGWRKTPSREALIALTRQMTPIKHEPLATKVAEEYADAILALMDGSNDE